VLTGRPAMRAIRVLAINLSLSGLAILGAALAFRLDPCWSEPLPGLLVIAAVPLLGCGASLIAAAAYTLWKHGGASGAPADPTMRLVTAGPYGWIRNPIYGGEALLLLGTALATGSATFLLLSLAFLPCIDLFVRLVEEPYTERRLGQEYAEYKRLVPRWIPALRRRRGRAGCNRQGHRR
jgi:protein-S-isoprenylcysteine O-methyltransferase Ste14